MKKLFIILFLLVNIFTMYSQEYDELKYNLHKQETYKENKVYIGVPHYFYKDTLIMTQRYNVYAEYVEMPEWTKVIDHSKTEYTYNAIPSYIWNDYKLGHKCFNAGIVTMSIGGALTILGGVLTGVAASDGKGSIPGTIALGVGGTMISISIPLFCFGDNMKRTCNREYKMYNELNK